MVIGERNSKDVSHFKLQCKNLYQDRKNPPKPPIIDIIDLPDYPSCDNTSWIWFPLCSYGPKDFKKVSHVRLQYENLHQDTQNPPKL